MALPAQQVQYNDPSELLEVYDHRGTATGRARTRLEVHRDGDWHLAFHCWVLRGGRREVVMQQRAMAKDTFPGLWDATAAGHWRFGETAEEAAREIDEELGLRVPFSQLRYAGRERISRRFTNGLTDREHHDVYVLESDASLTAYRPDPAEVAGLAAWPIGDVVELLAGRRERIRATEAVRVLADGGLSSETVVARREDVVPYSAARIRRLLRGFVLGPNTSAC